MIAIDVGEYAVCAIKADTTVWCWGTSLYPLPLASPDQRGVPMRITGLPRDIVKVVTSMWHACALRQNGTILCWGKGELEQLTGQLGPDILSVAFTPTVIAGVTDVVDIATGKNNVCARLANGTATCWGSNQWGQLGNGAGVRYPFPYGTPAEVQVLNQPARSVATGGYHTCAITDSNGAICWGSNNYGQLGSGTVSHIITQAVPVSGLSNGVAAISAGEHHSCALTNVGGVWCWGRNTHGQLGTGTNLDSAAPLPVTGLISGVQAIASGFNHNCALLIAGTLRCWGANSVGELGSGTNSPTVIPFPVAVQGLEGRRVLSVTAHTHHTCAIVEGGSAHCWGYNNYGQLGIPITTTISTTPITVTGLTSGTTAIAAGDGHSCAVVNGGARCWGWGASGQLGDGINDTSNGGSHIRDVPIQVTNLTSNTVDIRVGSHASCATLVDGSMRCWGQGALGTLGDGRSATSLIPTPVTGLPDRVVQFDLERSHVCAYLANLSLYCWGSDLYGQIGNGQVGFSSRPVNVQNITPAKWTYMLYLVGDNDLSEALNQVSRILDKWEKEAGNRSALNIAVFFDGQGDNDSYIWSTRNVGSERWHLNEEKTSLGDPQNLASFIKWARNNYPAEHYYLSIANHGRATTGIGWDSQSGADHLNALTPAEIHEALYEATLQGTQKIDILHFDACLMALLEMAYEVKDVAKYMIASQNLTAAFYPYDEYAKLVAANPQITATELAVGIAERYFNHKYLLVNQQPRTISVLDLQQIEPVITALDTFAGGLSVNKELVKSVREQVQVFDSSPDFNQKPPTYYTLTPDDEYVDLRDLAMRLPNISGAVALQQLLEEGRGFVLYSEAVTGIDKLVSGKEWQLDGSNGVSIFFPRSENVWDYPEYISEMEPIFTFNAVSQWDDFLRAYFNQAVPSQDDLKDPGIPPVLKPTKPITTHCGENQLCLWGAVYVDTFEQEGAQVTLQVGNSTWETTTTYKDENEAYPTYAFVVDPVLIPNGAELKLSAQGVYSKQQYLIDYTTRLALSRNEVEVNLHKVTSSAIPTLPTTIPTQVSILWAQLVTSTNASGEQILTGIAQGRVNNLANIVEYRWESNLDEIIASTSSFLFPVQALSPGMHRITLTVRTDNGVTSEPKTFDIHIPTPQPPVISILSPRANATFPAGTTVAVEATATDSDGTIEQVEFL
ncbi:MAG: hypothetical protein KDE47_22655, partial [Caldilineaceae bacterium]|nr:hypothetical protein [Caldilineaceae bacterium]